MKLLKQAIHFFWISGIGWCIDFLVFFTLNHFLTPTISNLCSATCGVSFTYWVSTRKTFFVNHTRFSLKYKYLIYLIYQIFLITISSLAVGLADGVFGRTSIQLFQDYSFVLAKICVTPFTMLINFTVMKILIESV